MPEFLDWDEPPKSVVILLASVLVHVQEMLGPGGHQMDTLALKGLMANPTLQAWLETVPEVLLPEKRS